MLNGLVGLPPAGGGPGLGKAIHIVHRQRDEFTSRLDDQQGASINGWVTAPQARTQGKHRQDVRTPGDKAPHGRRSTRQAGHRPRRQHLAYVLRR